MGYDEGYIFIDN